jgi:ABC-type branched-subunit amino acid transport system substrate-binding protein
MKALRLLLTLGLCQLLAGCPTKVDKPATPPVNADATVIGMLQPLANGSSLEKELAARLAISEINAAGGVNGKLLDLRVSYDDNNKAAVGVVSAQGLVDSGVVAIIGANASQVTLPVAQQVTIPAHIALITPSSTSPAISTLADNNTVYRIPPSDTLQGDLLAHLVWNEGHTSVATFTQNEPYGVGITQVFVQSFQQLGGTVTASVTAPLSKNSGYDAEIASLYTGGTPSALMLFAFPQPTANLLREILTAKGGLPALYGVDANMIQDTISNSPPQIAGMRGTTPAADTSTAEYQHFLAAYVAAVGAVPDPNTENAYDAVYLIALAMTKAGSNTRPAVLAGLDAVSQSGAGSGNTVIGPGGFAAALSAIKAGQTVGYRGASGPINFDANGDPTASTYQYLEVAPTVTGLGLITLSTITD